MNNDERNDEDTQRPLHDVGHTDQRYVAMGHRPLLKSNPTRASHRPIHGQIRRMLSPQGLTSGDFEVEFASDSHERGCASLTLILIVTHLRLVCLPVRVLTATARWSWPERQQWV